MFSHRGVARMWFHDCGLSALESDSFSVFAKAIICEWRIFRFLLATACVLLLSFLRLLDLSAFAKINSPVNIAFRS